MTSLEDSIEALADAWATLDGKKEQRDKCKQDTELESNLGYDRGYFCDAQGLLEILEDKGLTLTKGNKQHG